MTRGASMTVENSFNKGLLTEFTAMNFPESAVTDADNVVFSELGSVTRRLGIDYETDHQIHELPDLSSNPYTYTEYRWGSVSNQGTKTFLVQQVGDTLNFFGVSGEGSVSAEKKSFTVSLSDFKSQPSVTTIEISRLPCQYTNGLGYLVVVHPLCDPFYIKYNADDDDISSTQITIEVRDLTGLDDGLDVGERPETIEDVHKYNLLNQGWYFHYNNGSRTVLDIWEDHIGDEVSDYPSNADIWWLYKSATEQFDLSRVGNFTLGNTPAPKGHYIYNAFDIDRSTETGISGLESTSAGQARPSCAVFFAGRFWFGGVNTDKYSSNVYYSQSIERDDQIGKCYQINDPTSETVFDLIDTDGGVIPLPEIEKVITMKVVGSSLLVFGSNGIFTIRGDDNGAFRATSYTVGYVSSIGAVSPLSLVELDGTIMWINYNAMYLLQLDNIGINFVVQNVSKQTIQSLLDDIPQGNRDYIKGSYNKRLQIVQWIYSDSGNLTGNNYNRILEFNVASKAFYTHTIDTTKPRMCGIISLYGQGVSTEAEDVTVSGTTVTVSAVGVTVTVTSFTPNEEIFKYVVVSPDSATTGDFTYGDMMNTSHTDWETYYGDDLGKPYSSYGVSGYRIRGELLRNYQSTPISFVVKNILDGKLTVQGIWDYGSRISIGQEVYRNISSAPTNLIRRLKIRGKGKSFQIKFSSVDNHPFELIGWSTFDTGGSTP